MPEKYNIERDGAGQNISLFIKPPNSYIVWSILNMVFGALIFGVVGLIFSIKTKNRISEGKENIEKNFHQLLKSYYN